MTVTLTLDPGGRPKRELIEMAFADCGSAGYEFERTPEEIGGALMKLNAMMYEWPWSSLGFNHVAYGVGLPEDGSGLPNSTVHTVAAYLALRIAPNMGATLSGEQRAALARSLNNLHGAVATIPTNPWARKTMRGMGNKPYWAPFMNEGLVSAADTASDIALDVPGSANGGSSPYVPSYDFTDERNSQYL